MPSPGLNFVLIIGVHRAWAGQTTFLVQDSSSVKYKRSFLCLYIALVFNDARRASQPRGAHLANLPSYPKVLDQFKKQASTTGSKNFRRPDLELDGLDTRTGSSEVALRIMG
jgi:hypothetical protein